jgi:fructokinase
LGKDGALLLHKGVFYTQKGYPLEVRASDSFLETLLSLLLQEKDPKEALGKACAVGALVAQKKGANPEITEKMLGDFMRQSI